MNSRVATFSGPELATELNAMPIPIPKMKTPLKIASVVALKAEANDEPLEPLELLRLELAGRDGEGEGLGRRFIVAI
jgi:hypothetical protein